MPIKKISRLVGFSSLMLMSSVEAAFFAQNTEGWHWYQEPLIEILEQQPETSEKAAAQALPLTPSAIISAYQKELKQRLHKAWAYPSMKNLKAYQVMQKDLMQRSQHFAKTWMQVVYQNPSLDHSLAFPVNHQGRHLYLDQRKKAVKATIRSLSQDYGLFFFFSADCAYCHQFAPIVQQFSEAHGWSVLAISAEGGTLPEFPHALPDQGLIQQWKVEFFPALFAVNPKTGDILALAYGLSALDEIEQRVMALVQAPNRGAPL